MRRLLWIKFQADFSSDFDVQGGEMRCCGKRRRCQPVIGWVFKWVRTGLTKAEGGGVIDVGEGGEGEGSKCVG